MGGYEALAHAFFPAATALYSSHRSRYGAVAANAFSFPSTGSGTDRVTFAHASGLALNISARKSVSDTADAPCLGGSYRVCNLGRYRRHPLSVVVVIANSRYANTTRK